MIGALVAMALLSLMQKALRAYIDHVPGHEPVYGALATLSVFLLWLYLFWNIVLFGASLTAELHSGGRWGQRDARMNENRPWESARQSHPDRDNAWRRRLAGDRRGVVMG